MGEAEGGDFNDVANGDVIEGPPARTPAAIGAVQGAEVDAGFSAFVFFGDEEVKGFLTFAFEPGVTPRCVEVFRNDAFAAVGDGLFQEVAAGARGDRGALEVVAGRPGAAGSARDDDVEVREAFAQGQRSEVGAGVREAVEGDEGARGAGRGAHEFAGEGGDVGVEDVPGAVVFFFVEDVGGGAPFEAGGEGDGFEWWARDVHRAFSRKAILLAQNSRSAAARRDSLRCLGSLTVALWRVRALAYSARASWSCAWRYSGVIGRAFVSSRNRPRTGVTFVTWSECGYAREMSSLTRRAGSLGKAARASITHEGGSGFAPGGVADVAPVAGALGTAAGTVAGRDVATLAVCFACAEFDGFWIAHRPQNCTCQIRQA